MDAFLISFLQPLDIALHHFILLYIFPPLYKVLMYRET